jgi:hypothetical protein
MLGIYERRIFSNIMLGYFKKRKSSDSIGIYSLLSALCMILPDLRD